MERGGNVGIGVSPSHKLHVYEGARNGGYAINGSYDALVVEGTQHVGISIAGGSNNSGSAAIAFPNGSSNIDGLINYNHGGRYLAFHVGGSERTRVHSTGVFMVGKTAPSFDNVGFQVTQDGQAAFTRDGSQALYVNRKTTDGPIVELRQDNDAQLLLGSKFTGRGYISTNVANSTGLRFDTNFIAPCDGTGANRDNVIDIGSSGARFDDIHATNSTIQTSDQQEKNTITDSDLGLDFINRLSPKSYIFNGKTRTHYGLIAQDIETVLGDISKPTSGFAGFIKSDISAEQDGSEYRYGLRYGEFIGPLIQAVKDLKAELDAAKARIETLENA